MTKWTNTVCIAYICTYIAFNIYSNNIAMAQNYTQYTPSYSNTNIASNPSIDNNNRLPITAQTSNDNRHLLQRNSGLNTAQYPYRRESGFVSPGNYNYYNQSSMPNYQKQYAKQSNGGFNEEIVQVLKQGDENNKYLDDVSKFNKEANWFKRIFTLPMRKEY